MCEQIVSLLSIILACVAIYLARQQLSLAQKHYRRNNAKETLFGLMSLAQAQFKLADDVLKTNSTITKRDFRNQIYCVEGYPSYAIALSTEWNEDEPLESGINQIKEILLKVRKDCLPLEDTPLTPNELDKLKAPFIVAREFLIKFKLDQD